MINKINKLPKSEFIKVFANIFENAIWIAEKLYNQKPFDNFEELSSKMLNIFETAKKEKQLKILKDHPDLANKTKISSLTPDSLKEQTSAGLDQCTEEEFNEFKKLNDSYKKFGFPFILAVKGKTKTEILNNFKKRIYSDPETEFNEAISYITKLKGLGVWSAEMFLMFNLNRPNIFPVKDIGLLRAISKNYKSSYPPSNKFLDKISKRHDGYKTVFTWYMWRSIDPSDVEY